MGSLLDEAGDLTTVAQRRPYREVKTINYPHFGSSSLAVISMMGNKAADLSNVSVRLLF